MFTATLFTFNAALSKDGTISHVGCWDKKLWKTSNKKHVIQSLLWFQAINRSQIHNLLSALIFGAFSDSAFSLSNVCYKVLTYKV